jgi:arylsulfatase A-like enzyme
LEIEVAMKSRCCIRVLSLGACLSVSLIALWATAAGTKPNVVVLMTDDQGYGDLACHGNPIVRTPNMDALHARSVRLTNFHVDPTCSPTRSALMTGRYSHRVKVWHTIIGRNMLQKDELTMADLFGRNGYRTGHFGKWHLGTNYPYRPIDRGFDEWLGQGDGGTGTATDHWGNDRVGDTYLLGGRKTPIEGYAPDVFFDEAIGFIRANKDRPFFVYLATYVPHSPWSLPERSWVDPYRGKVPLSTAYFFASISRVDHNLGRLRRCLAEEGLAENTLFVFLTDNGTSGGDKVYSAGMRGKKGSQYDGGHRVPCFFHWPAGGLDEPVDVARLAAHIDLLPTLADLCGLGLPDGVELDGTSLKPLLFDPQGPWPERTLVVESQRVPHPEKGRRHAVMTDRWRMVDGKELFDMTSDTAQRHNVAVQHPDVADKLHKAYERYWAGVTRGDDEYARPVLGSPHQDEVYLCSEDWMPLEGPCPWSQGHVARGNLAFGYWPVRVSAAGRYRFEVRRWPRELDAPMAGVPRQGDSRDAYLGDELIRGTLYPAEPRAIPAAKIGLKVAGTVREAMILPEETAKVFTLELESGPARVEAQLLDADGKAIGGAYYVYARPVK